MLRLERFNIGLEASDFGLYMIKMSLIPRFQRHFGVFNFSHNLCQIRINHTFLSYFIDDQTSCRISDQHFLKHEWLRTIMVDRISVQQYGSMEGGR